MALKLFHQSEFAQSRLSPQRQSSSLHPAVLALVVSLWVATAGNVTLWRDLLALPGMEDSQKLWLGLDMLAIITACCSALLSLLCWRWTLKLAAFSLLLLAAWGADMLLFGKGAMDDAMLTSALRAPLQAFMANGIGQGAAVLLVLLVLLVPPGIWLWRTPMRRLPWRRNARHNLVLLLVSAAVFVVAGLLFHEIPQHQQLRELLNPMNLVHAVADAQAISVEQTALPR